MAFNAAIGDGPSQRRGWPGTALFAVTAVGSSLIIAAWMTGSDLTTLASAALPDNPDRAIFEDRFLLETTPNDGAALRLSKRFVAARVEAEAAPARDPFALRWMPADWRAGIADSQPGVVGTGAIDTGVVGTKPVAAADIPLPRPRPAAADFEVRPGPTLALADNPGRSADRPLLQKLSDLVAGRMTLASLAPNGGLLQRGPDLALFGYDGLTAVYDISAHAVYLPNGVVLEAHSGLGSLRDDPDHVSVHNLGATPPAVYALKPREREFHGVPALRMTPADGSDIAGRSGLLVHSFMLGPNGDSNGCISIKEYDRFLKAFNDGQINRIAVVPSLKAMTLASQSPT